MIGDVLLHYRILRQLGSGGMGIVYEAEDTRLGRHVALKFLPESIGVDAEVVDRFEREAKIASSLNHPNICTIYDIGVHDGRRFIVMELLDGEPLRSHIGDRPLPLDQLLDIGCQLADALDAAHAKHIVHRDVKPANVFITRRGQAKLLDFGVAKLGGERHGHDAAAETRVAGEALTTPGMAVGSINYMSPEQARGEELDGRTDLFSLGLVLYEMATGRQAFGGQTTAVVFDAILNRQPPDPRATNPDLPEDLIRVIQRALEKDRRMRFQSAADMLAELSRIRRDTTGARTMAQPAAAADAGVTETPWTSRSAAAGTASPPAAPVAGRGAARSRPSWTTLAAGAAAVALVAIGYVVFGGTATTPAFAERDTVLVADFVNSTGEAVFDDALKQAVAVQLQQTPFVTLLPDQQVQRTLRLMQREAETPVTGSVARELCQRAGAKATVEGSIAPLGSAYVLTLGVFNCQTGAPLAQEQVQAGAREEVLARVGDAVTALRQGLGESLGSIEKYDVPVTEASTASLDALKAYGLGLRTRVTKGDEASVPFFQQAIALDPDFALAHAKLSVVLSNIGRAAEARDAGARAFALRDRVSEYERLYITWNHAARVEVDQQRQRETLELINASYPRDFSARNNLGVYYMTRGEFEKALEQFEIATSIAPGEPLPLSNGAQALLNLGRREEAYAWIDRSLAVRPDPGLALSRWTSALAAGDPRTAEYARTAEAIAPPERLTQVRQLVLLWHGQLDAADAAAKQALAQLRTSGTAEQVAGYEFHTATNFAALDRGPYLRSLESFMAAGRPAFLRAQAAAITAIFGRADAARATIAAFEAEGRLTDDIRGPVAVGRAFLLARDGQTADAIASVEATITEFGGRRDLRFYLGLLREMAGDLGGAVTDYHAAYGYLPVMQLDPIVPVVKLTYADALVRQGRLDDARRIVDEVLAQWKDPDREFEMLVRARALRAKIGQ